MRIFGFVGGSQKETTVVDVYRIPYTNVGSGKGRDHLWGLVGDTEGNAWTPSSRESHMCHGDFDIFTLGW